MLKETLIQGGTQFINISQQDSKVSKGCAVLIELEMLRTQRNSQYSMMFYLFEQMDYKKQGTLRNAKDCRELQF